MAEVEWETTDPSIDIFVQEVRLMLVDIDAVNTAPHQAIFVSVEWLEMLLTFFAVYQRGQKSIGLIALFVSCPSGVGFGVTVVDVSGEIPITSEHRKTPVLGTHHAAHGAHGVNAGFRVAGVQVNTPHVECTKVAPELEYRSSVLVGKYPVGCLEELEEAILDRQSNPSFAHHQGSIVRMRFFPRRIM